MADPAADQPVLILAGEFGSISGRLRMRRVSHALPSGAVQTFGLASLSDAKVRWKMLTLRK